MKNKKQKVTIIGICLTVLLNNNIFAISNDSTSAPGRTCDWSPYITSETASGLSDGVRMRSDFYFSSNALNIIDSSIFAYRFTFEHCATEGTSVSLSDHYTNIPDPVFDTDDDDGDGNFEEAEVTCSTANALVDNYNYYSATWWSRALSQTSGDIDSRGQISLMAGEYQAVASDYYNSYHWSYPANSTSLSQNNTQTHESFNVEELSFDKYDTSHCHFIQKSNSKFIKLIDDINTMTDMENYRVNVTEAFSEIKENDVLTTQLISNEKTAAVITFNEPVSVDYLLTLLSEDCELVNYEAQFVDSFNSYSTLCSKRLSENDIINTAHIISDNDDLTFSGITSATLRISPHNDTYDKLCAERKIYLVDMSEYITRVQNNDPSLNVVVSDCYYKLSNCKK